MKIKKSTWSNLITYLLVIAAFIICQSMLDGGTMPRTIKNQLIPICVYIVMAVSLNLTVGISGELSLGHAGFMSVGAFTGTVISTWMLSAFQMENETLRLILSILAGGVTASIAGVLIGIPVLRLRGDYLAIVTLAFGEIIRNVLTCLYISVDGAALHVGQLAVLRQQHKAGHLVHRIGGQQRDRFGQAGKGHQAKQKKQANLCYV